MLTDGYNPFAQTRFQVPSALKNILEDYSGRTAQAESQNVFNRQMDCFLLAAALGARQEIWIDNEEAGVEMDGFVDGNVLKLPEVEFLYMLALQKEDALEIIQEPNAIVKIAEGYAHGGLPILEDLLNKGNLSAAANLSRGLNKLLNPK